MWILRALLIDLICHFKGHVWGEPRQTLRPETKTVEWCNSCKRCGYFTY